MNNTELERAKELKHKLDVAWKQVHEFGQELISMGFSVAIEYLDANDGQIKASGISSAKEPNVSVLKTEVIEL